MRGLLLFVAGLVSIMAILLIVRRYQAGEDEALRAAAGRCDVEVTLSVGLNLVSGSNHVFAFDRCQNLECASIEHHYSCTCADVQELLIRIR